MNLDKDIQKSIDLYLNNWGIIFISTLIASILSVISLAILAGPLFGGLLILNLKILRGKPVELIEIFAHFKKFFPTLLLFLVAGIGLLITWSIPVIGAFISVILSPFILIVTMFAIITIIEKNYTPVLAVKEGIAFFKTDPIIIWIYGLIIAILSAIGMIIFGIGVLLTIPFSTCGIAVAYQEYSNKEGYFKVSSSGVHRPST